MQGNGSVSAVNLQIVEEALKEMRAQVTALQTCLDALTQEVKAAKEDRDEFSVHIYRARLNYRRVVENDKTKQQNRVEREVRSSFIKAMELGFRGSALDWQQLLKAQPVRKPET